MSNNDLQDLSCVKQIGSHYTFSQIQVKVQSHCKLFNYNKKGICNKAIIVSMTEKQSSLIVSVKH